MKKILFLGIGFFVVAGFSILNAQKKAKWNEMEAFHNVMSQTFHPAEEGKLEPIRTRSQEMLDKAIAWKKSTPPEGYNKSETAPQLKKLVKGSKELNKMVMAKAPDKEITEKLSALHDVFHKLMDE